MQRLARKVIIMNRLTGVWRSRDPYLPLNHHCERASDGTEILDYYELSVEEVLKDRPSHPRILVDWERNLLPSKKFSYCILELRSFLSIPHRNYQFTEKEKAMLSSPIPMVATKEELKVLLTSWFNLFNYWIFGNTLLSTAISVVDEIGPRIFGVYFKDIDTLKFAARSDTSHFPGSPEEFKLSVLLHEMLHAFMFQYSCQKECCKVLYHPALGGCGSGHGPAWADSMVDLSDILRQAVSWEVEVGMRGSVGESMCLEGWQPNKRQLEFWGLDSSIWCHIDQWDSRRNRFLAAYNTMPAENNPR